jgi:osmoprotectant transport system ATP-binding protein
MRNARPCARARLARESPGRGLASPRKAFNPFGMALSTEAGASQAPALSLRKLAKSFDGGARWAVRDLSLDVAGGEFLALVGGSGSGKTTTLKMINRLIEPDQGDVLIAGEDARAAPAHELRRRIGYVFQGVGLFPHLTVAENVGVIPRLLDWEKPAIDARVAELLDLVELPAADYAVRLPQALSGGQRQRVGFARALAARPRIVLMDEPFGALDPLTRDTLGQAYLSLHQKLGLTTIMVTHDMTEALMLADRLGVMSDGALVALGAPAALLSDCAEPYVQNLLATPRAQARRIEQRFGEWAPQADG